MARSFYKHERVAEVLAREIRTGQLPAGSQLPGEQSLRHRFAVSRTTVRQALAALQNQGLIATRVGIGSIVTFDDTPLDDRHGWTRALADVGATLTTEVLRLELIEDPALAAAVGVESAGFLALDRLRRLTDDTAVSLERSRVPLREGLEHVPEQGLLRDSLTATLDAASAVAVSGEEWAELTLLTEADAQALERRQNEPFLGLRRLSRDARGDVVEHVHSLLDPARFRLHLEFGDVVR